MDLKLSVNDVFNQLKSNCDIYKGVANIKSTNNI